MKSIWLGALFIFLFATIIWIIDSRLYDNDLENDHIRETGYSWSEIE